MKRLPVVAFALAMSGLAAVVSPAAASTKTPLNKNLIRNGSAEANQGGNGNTGASPKNWSIAAGAWKVVKYGTPAFPTKSESNRIGGGKNFMACGPDTETGIALQQFSVRGRDTQTDTGQLAYKFSLQMATFQSQGDSGGAIVFFLDSGGILIKSATSNTVSATNGLFQRILLTGSVPVGTRSIKIQLNAHRVDGSYCDVYIDKVSLVLFKD